MDMLDKGSGPECDGYTYFDQWGGADSRECDFGLFASNICPMRKDFPSPLERKEFFLCKDFSRMICEEPVRFFFFLEKVLEYWKNPSRKKVDTYQNQMSFLLFTLEQNLDHLLQVCEENKNTHPVGEIKQDCEAILGDIVYRIADSYERKFRRVTQADRANAADQITHLLKLSIELNQKSGNHYLFYNTTSSLARLYQAYFATEYKKAAAFSRAYARNLTPQASVVKREKRVKSLLSSQSDKSVFTCAVQAAIQGNMEMRCAVLRHPDILVDVNFSPDPKVLQEWRKLFESDLYTHITVKRYESAVGGKPTTPPYEAELVNYFNNFEEHCLLDGLTLAHQKAGMFLDLISYDPALQQKCLDHDSFNPVLIAQRGDLDRMNVLLRMLAPNYGDETGSICTQEFVALALPPTNVYRGMPACGRFNNYALFPQASTQPIVPRTIKKKGQNSLKCLRIRLAQRVTDASTLPTWCDLRRMPKCP